MALTAGLRGVLREGWDKALDCLGRVALGGALAMVCGTLLACGHTPRSKQARILGQVEETNTRNERAVLSRFLRAEHLTLIEFEPKSQWLANPANDERIRYSDASETAPGRLRLHNRSETLRPLNMGWSQFDTLMEREGSAEVNTSSGEVLLLFLVKERGTSDWNHRYLAKTESGGLLLIETRLRPTLRHLLTLPGNCDRMPVLSTTPGWRVIVFEEDHMPRFKEQKRVKLTYEGESVSSRCESYTD